MSENFLILMAGLPGTGKTVASEKLAKELGYELVSQNKVRREQGMKKMPKSQEGVLHEVDRRISKFLKEGKGVVLDAAQRYGHRRHQLYGIASGLETDVIVLECICSEEEAKKRMKARPHGDGLLVDAYDPKVYDKVKSGWEEIQADFRDYSDHVTHIVYDSEKRELNKDLVRDRAKGIADRIEKVLT